MNWYELAQQWADTSPAPWVRESNDLIEDARGQYVCCDRHATSHSQLDCNMRLIRSAPQLRDKLFEIGIASNDQSIYQLLQDTF